jgi:FolB domain-containing protein
MDIIRIHRLELDCIVGTRPQEREHRQRVRLDLRLHADLSPAGRTGRISLTTDYDQVANEVMALLSFRHYHLIEMAAEEVSAMLLGVHTGIERVDLRIEKPGALAGRARAASVEVRRSRSDFPSTERVEPYGQIEVLLDTREARLELLRISPSAVAEGGPGFPADALHWLTSGVLSPGAGEVEPRLPGEATQASSEAPTPLHNPGPDPACLFRCWRRILPGH